MSVARVKTVTRSMKPYTCGKCGVELPKGSEYRWYKVGFRSRTRRIRCMSAQCTPRNSELDDSKMSGVWAALETAEDNIVAASSIDDLKEALESAAEEIRDVATEYSDAADAMGDAGYEMQEKADALEEAASELEGTSLSEPDEEIDCDDCEGTGQVDNPDYDPEDEESDEPEFVDCETCEGSGRVEAEQPDIEEARGEATDAVNAFEVP